MAGGTVAPTPKVVPAILIKKQKLTTNDDPHLPPEVKARHRCEIVSGSYKVCIAESGEIASVNPINGIAGADNEIIATVKKWRYKPQAVPICFVQFFEYHIDGGEACFQPERAARWLDSRVTALERNSPSVHQQLEILRNRIDQLEATCGASAPGGDARGGARVPAVGPGQLK